MDLLAGVSYPLRALALISRAPRLWRFVLVPIMINILVGAVLYLGLAAGVWQQLQARLGDGAQNVGEVFVAAVTVLLAVALAVTIGFVLVRFGVVLGAPWYGQLSEELEGMVAGHVQRPDRLSPGVVLYEIWRALLFEGKKLGLALAVWLASLLLLLIPGAGGLLYAGAGTLIGAMISCLDFFDGPQERRRLAFRQKLGTVRRTFPASLSFGLVAFGLVSIPVVNLLAIPLCVTAGNLFVLERALVAPRGTAGTPGSPASGPVV